MKTIQRESDLKKINDYRMTLEGTDTDTLLKRAEEAMEGMLVLNGTGPEPVFVGIPPHWEENPCGVGGYTWTMSRLKYMPTLCKAYLLTKKRRYLDKVENDLQNWFDTVPAPPVPVDYESACIYHGVHNWRMLELGYRMVYTFPLLLCVLRTYGNPDLVTRIYASIAEHAERISAGSHLLWPGFNHNHYTEEISGLLSAASMIPEHPMASQWIEQAMDGIEKACANQLTEDGAQIEGAAEYHAAVVINFCYTIHFARLCGRSFSPEFVSRVKNGIAFAVHTLSPDGNMMPYGDSDLHLYTPIEAALLGCLLFHDYSYLATLRQFVDSKRILQLFTDFCPWGFDNIPKLLSWLKMPLPSEKPILLPTCTYQRQVDQYILRSSWKWDAAYLFFSCHSPIHYGNHAHMDQLGIIFGAYGKVLLQDPGRYTYKDCEDRHLFKSSQVHSMPTINGKDAFEYIATFEYGPQKEGSITSVMDTGRIKGVRGVHHNYDPVAISRSVAMIDHRFLLIADTFEHVKGETMKVFFHLNSTSAVIREGDIVTRDSNANLRISCSLSAEEIDTELLDGRLSDIFYHDYHSKRAAYTRRAVKDTETLYFIASPFSDKVSDSLRNFKEKEGILTFALEDTEYCIKFHDGIFTMC